MSGGQEVPQTSPSETVDLAKSLSTFIMIFDNEGKTLISTAKLDGQTPSLPKGVLDAARKSGQNKITWMPKKDVRSAVVITKYSANSKTGFVLVGRSLREVEKREGLLLLYVGAVWLITMLTTFVVSVVFTRKPIKIKI